MQYLFWWWVAANDSEPCSAILAFVIPLAWIIGVIHFRESCLGRPGWARALFSYHIWGLLLIGGTVGGFAVLVRLVLQYGKRLYAAIPEGDLLAISAIAVLYVPALLSVVPRVYRLARGPLLPLQREVAIRIARDEVRKRLTREQRGLWR